MAEFGFRPLSREERAEIEREEESRRAINETNARPVEITAIVDGEERKLSAPHWMFRSFTGMVQEFNEQLEFHKRELGRKIFDLAPKSEPDADA